MIARLEAAELEPVRSTDHHHARSGPDNILLAQFAQHRQRHSGMRAGIHASFIGKCSRCRQLLLAGLLHQPIRLPDSLHRLGIAYGRADADGRGLRGLRLHGHRRRKIIAEALVKRIGAAGLGSHKPRQARDYSQILQQLQALVERANVAQVARRHDDPFRHGPVKLAHNLHAHGLLAFNAQAVHGVCQVDAVVLRHFAHYTHAAVKVRVQRQHVRAMRQRLHQLRIAHLVSRQKDNCRDAGRRCICRQRRAGIAGAGTRHGAHRAAVGNHLFHHAHQHRHAQVFEAASVAVAAQLYPQVIQPDAAPKAIRPKKVGVALVHADNIFVAQLRRHPLLHAPHAAAVWPARGGCAAVQQLAPFRRRGQAQCIQIMLHFQQSAAVRAQVQNRVDRVAATAPVKTVQIGAIAAGHGSGRCVRGKRCVYFSCHAGSTSAPLLRDRFVCALPLASML